MSKVVLIPIHKVTLQKILTHKDPPQPRFSSFEVIQSLIDEVDAPPTSKIKEYTKATVIKGLFLAEDQFDEMFPALGE